MLLSLSDLIRKYNMKITGVIHAGAHYGEEDGDYLTHGITKRYYFEPAKEAYEILIANTPGAEHRNFALGACHKTEVMNIERHNKGQSNSLLKPGTHLKHYPLIEFNDTELVTVLDLDSFGIHDCNLLNMDVQGYELEILKGATETLKHIDYIYTEVNTDEVYIGCGKLHEMDAFLKDFQRVELSMTGQGWGDALYIRLKSQIVSVPEEFRPHHPLQYPPDNDLIFEEWYYQQEHPYTDRVYLPIFWTSYYCRHNYGKNKMALNRLQMFLNKLDRSKKYYTIVQFDDGILNDITQLDLFVFAMSGDRIDYPLPLICKPHNYNFPGIQKDIFCSYVGANNHPIRRQLMQYQNKTGWYISDQPHTLEQFCNILARSKYVLCPRGYGKTSFRIMEALQYGAVPVYLSDDHIIPHKNFEYGIYWNSCENLPGYMEELENLNVGRMDSVAAFNKYFTYEANKNIIHEVLCNK